MATAPVSETYTTMVNIGTLDPSMFTSTAMKSILGFASDQSEIDKENNYSANLLSTSPSRLQKNNSVGGVPGLASMVDHNYNPKSATVGFGGIPCDHNLASSISMRLGHSLQEPANAAKEVVSVQGPSDSAKQLYTSHFTGLASYGLSGMTIQDELTDHAFKVSLIPSLNFKDLYLYTAGVLFTIKWSLRQL